MYHAVGKRCAVDPTDLPEGSIDVLTANGFQVIEVDLIAEARRCIGVTQFRLLAALNDAPRFMDCSGFVKYLYGLKGVWIPRLAIQQRRFGTSLRVEALTAGDLVFATGPHSYFDTDPEDDVGHANMVINSETMISNTNGGVVEGSLEKLVNNPDRYRGACRIALASTITWRVPDHIDIETSDDLRWLVLRKW